VLLDRSVLVSTEVHRNIHDVSGNSLATHAERGVPAYVHVVDERQRTALCAGTYVIGET
jgi:hypothetical protein